MCLFEPGHYFGNLRYLTFEHYFKVNKVDLLKIPCNVSHNFLTLFLGVQNVKKNFWQFMGLQTFHGFTFDLWPPLNVRWGCQTQITLYLPYYWSPRFGDSNIACGNLLTVNLFVGSDLTFYHCFKVSSPKSASIFIIGVWSMKADCKAQIVNVLACQIKNLTPVSRSKRTGSVTSSRSNDLNTPHSLAPH